MEIIKFRITGTRPLLMHSDKFVDPLNPLTVEHKKLTSVKKKTDETHVAIAYSEWRAGMHYDEGIGPYIPSTMIEANIISGAKLSKLGTHAKRAIEVLDFKVPLQYEGPRTIEGLWEQRFYDARSVKVQTARLMRYRPMWLNWWAEFELAFDGEVLDRSQVISAVEAGGALIGIGDYRPKFGRFSVEVVQ